MTALRLTVGEERSLADYLDRLLGLDDRAAVRLQAAGSVLGVWGGPPFGVVALRPVGLAEAAWVDVTVSARRLRDRLDGAGELGVPPAVPGPSWVGLLPPRSGWEERGRADVGYVRDAVDLARRSFAERAVGVTDQVALDAIADDVWQRGCVGELPVRTAHAAEALGLLGPASGEVVGYASGSWLRLAAPGGSVAVRRGPGIGLFAV